MSVHLRSVLYDNNIPADLCHLVVDHLPSHLLIFSARPYARRQWKYFNAHTFEEFYRNFCKVYGAIIPTDKYCLRLCISQNGYSIKSYAFDYQGVKSQRRIGVLMKQAKKMIDAL